MRSALTSSCGSILTCPLLALVLIVLALLTACQPQRSLTDRAPAAIPAQGTPQWTSTAAEPISSSELPTGALSGTRLTYTGPTPITVDLFQMSSSSSAFEAVQKWRTTPGKSITNRDDLFLVFTYTQPDLAREFGPQFLAALH